MVAAEIASPKVLSDGYWREYPWTVKVDPDAAGDPAVAAAMTLGRVWQIMDGPKERYIGL